MSKKARYAALALVAAMVLFFGVWLLVRPAGIEGEKNLTIEVIHADQRTVTFEISTDAEYLDEALTEHNIAQGSESTYGLFIETVDGETADSSKQEWWCITRGGESLMAGASELPVADGETYELTLMVGYD